ncbi:methionine adenosyltransferase [Arcanobacterium hippocoleae]|uniref:methionine adenosyltransferase n=1 Tax=Arcanobacterium hippocoleae TaxID=149017 RepID=UPI00333F47B4
MTTRFVTAEAVCIGHPDKLCDLIADTIVDAALEADPTSRTAIEVMATGRSIIVGGEIACPKTLPIRALIRKALKRAGYEAQRFKITVLLRSQSADIAQGLTDSVEARSGEVDAIFRVGAGDQGTVYGYATAQTGERLPLALLLAHTLCQRIDTVRETGVIAGIHSDGKAQVTLRYTDDKPVVDTVVVSVQHDTDKPLEVLKRELIEHVIKPTLAAKRLDCHDDIRILINPTGAFTVGGPEADCGLTGRKLMVDTYGGLALHGGGAFSGKDGTKVDRSAAYMARLVARTIVDADLALEATVAISYAIGKAEPVAIHINTQGSAKMDEEKLSRCVREVFDLRPQAIIDALSLAGGQHFVDTATYGHFGRTAFPWENTSAYVTELKTLLEGGDAR